MTKILLKPKLVKHNRDIIPKDSRDYGHLAEHDLLVTLVIGYVNGPTVDANGTKLAVTEEWLKFTAKKSNSFIRQKLQGPFAKAKSYLTTDLDAEVVPISFDHQSSAKHVSGYTKGLFVLKDHDGELGLFVNALIKDNDTKSKLLNGLIREVSLGTRGDGSIKEISFVQNAALGSAGVLMSEDNHNQLIQLSEKGIELQSEINFLELQEDEVHNNIKNHVLFCEMLKNGKIRPNFYEDFIGREYSENKNRNAELVAHDIGIVFGNTIQPTILRNEQLSQIEQASQVIQEWRNQQESNPKSGDVSHNISCAENSSVSIVEQHYKSLLTEIKDLSNHCPDLVSDLIKTELGENKFINPDDQDLQKYYIKLQEIKTKKQSLIIQLQELSNE